MRVFCRGRELSNVVCRVSVKKSVERNERNRGKEIRVIQSFSFGSEKRGEEKKKKKRERDRDNRTKDDSEIETDLI